MERTFKFIVYGVSGVGKTALLLRYIDDKFYPNHEATIGVDFSTKFVNVNGRRIRLHIVRKLFFELMILVGHR